MIDDQDGRRLWVEAKVAKESVVEACIGHVSLAPLHPFIRAYDGIIRNTTGLTSHFHFCTGADRDDRSLVEGVRLGDTCEVVGRYRVELVEVLTQRTIVATQ